MSGLYSCRITGLATKILRWGRFPQIAVLSELAARKIRPQIQGQNRQYGLCLLAESEVGISGEISGVAGS